MFSTIYKNKVKLFIKYTYIDYLKGVCVMDCVFCEIANLDPKKQILRRYKKIDLFQVCDVIVFEPLNPCVNGHLLFVPDLHIENIGDMGFVAGDVIGSVFKAINMYLKENQIECNVITNNGDDADQTVFHIHAHVVPRTIGDDVKLPWSNNKKNI